MNNAKKNRKTKKLVRLEIFSRKLKLTRKRFMQEGHEKGQKW